MLFVLVAAGNLFAADVTTDFSAANRLYAEGKFSEAATAYENILHTGAQSPALLFNDANAEFKTGKLGKAIAAYRQAALLAPRDAEIRANLQFVRNQVQGSTIRESRWQGWLGALTLNEWTLLVSGAFWLTLLLLTAAQLARASRPFDEKLKHPGRMPVPLKLRRTAGIPFFVTLLSGAALTLQAVEHFYGQTAVVILPEATARSGPFAEAQSAFTAHDGAELAILERHGDWVQAADSSGKIGWLAVKQVEILPGA